MGFFINAKKIGCFQYVKDPYCRAWELHDACSDLVYGLVPQIILYIESGHRTIKIWYRHVMLNCPPIRKTVEIEQVNMLEVV